MNAKSRAEFINAAAYGEMAPCPKCGAQNEPGAANCSVCGAQMTRAPMPSAADECVFAQGLPDWDIVPPQVVVRRRKRAI